VNIDSDNCARLDGCERSSMFPDLIRSDGRGSLMMTFGRTLVGVALCGFALLGCDSTSPVVATRLAFSTQPAPGIVSTQPLGDVRVSVLSADGRIATGTAYQVTISLSASDTAAHLAGTTTVAPALILVGSDIPAVVRITDAGGNALPGATNPVTLAATRTLPFGTTVATDGLFGPATRAAVNGVVTFRGLTVHESGVYALPASSPGISGATSGSLTVQAGPMTRLIFVTQPSDGTANTPLAAFSVQQVDDYGNGASLPPGGVYGATLSTGNNPGGAALRGTLTVSGFGVGALTFNDVSLDKPGTGYTLVVTSEGRTLTSTPFSIH
jgi:hypothetical protein